MAHRDLLVEGRQGTGEGRGGVSLHQHQGGTMQAELLLQALQRGTGHVGEGLVGGHQGQIVVSPEVEQLHHLAHHLAVLPGEHHPGAEGGGGLKGQDHRGQLDRFRAGAQHDRHQGRAWGCGLGSGGCGSGDSRQDQAADPLILRISARCPPRFSAEPLTPSGRGFGDGGPAGGTVRPLALKPPPRSHGRTALCVQPRHTTGGGAPAPTASSPPPPGGRKRAGNQSRHPGRTTASGCPRPSGHPGLGEPGTSRHPGRIAGQP